jgi:small-conductance mechanosensitive channel
MEIGEIINKAYSLIPTVFSVVLVIGAYKVTQSLLTKKSSGSGGLTLIRQTILFTIGFIGFFMILLALPINHELRGQLLSLLGIVLAASISLSSTSLLGNAMAALNIGMVNSFKIGDFIRCGDIFGRVTSKGLFHTEVQTENRDLMTIPNLHLVTNHVTVTRASGTILSGVVSLGYDVSRVLIEKTLIKAAEKAGLIDGFVFVTELGDFSVVYKVSGLLKDVNKILSVKSKLNKAMIDLLHEADIEIVSPTFMNQRQVNDTVFIHKSRKTDTQLEADKAESVIFDKAEKAEEIEKKEMKLEEVVAKIEELESERKSAKSEDKPTFDERIENLKNIKLRLETRIAEQKDKLNKEG